MIVGEVLFISPLIRMHVVPARCVLQSRRREPVLGQRDRRPRFRRSQLFLADIVSQSATVLADAAAEHQRVNAGAIHQVGVIPVIDARTDQDRAFAFGVFGGRAPFAGKANQHIATDARVLFAPGGRVRCVFIVVVGRVFAGQVRD